METLNNSTSPEILTVSRLNREVKFLLEGSFSFIWIEGEISNFAAPYSGHWYFSLKDVMAQVRCAMFRQDNRNIKFQPKDGMQVLIRARVTLYEGRGDYQLIAEHIEEAGQGRLQQEFDALKKRLSAAGFFDSAHKKALPRFPKTIGIITSPSGAAIRDILTILQRRFACANIIIYKTLVQGELAAANIANALQVANRRAECDLLILTRGGGSLEDLWPFNEEKVAQAIYQCAIPIISGVGHEIDFTIADFVADIRAPTPSAAAELAVPAGGELLDSIQQEKRHLFNLIHQKIIHAKQRLLWVNKHLDQQHPKRRLAIQMQQLDLQEASLIRLQSKRLLAYQSKLQTLKAKLVGLTPQHRIYQTKQHLSHDNKHIQNCMTKLLHHYQTEFSRLAGKLDALSPLSTLSRGYSIVTDKNNKILRSANEAKQGDNLKIQLFEGQLDCLVEKIKANSN